MQRDWRNPDDYQFTETLSPELWAWQFLRRNTEYRKDYDWFIGNWRALEADYGKAPNRNFSKWKLDDRAYAPDEMTQGFCENDKSCASPDGDRVLIECAMGAKWGFYKFPNAPDVEFPAVPGRLLWREQEAWLPDMDSPAKPHELDVRFDLRLPAQQQLVELKRLLAVQQSAYQKSQGWNTKRLRRYLRLLDADNEETQVRQMLYAGDADGYERDLLLARNLRDHDYRLLVIGIIR